ncbi:hypothetical protein PCE1_000952 [Barthelona sp. PCE]
MVPPLKYKSADAHLKAIEEFQTTTKFPSQAFTAKTKKARRKAKKLSEKQQYLLDMRGLFKEQRELERSIEKDLRHYSDENDTDAVNAFVDEVLALQTSSEHYKYQLKQELHSTQVYCLRLINETEALGERGDLNGTWEAVNSITTSFKQRNDASKEHLEYLFLELEQESKTNNVLALPKMPISSTFFDTYKFEQGYFQQFPTELQRTLFSLLEDVLSGCIEAHVAARAKIDDLFAPIDPLENYPDVALLIRAELEKPTPNIISELIPYALQTAGVPKDEWPIIGALSLEYIEHYRGVQAYNNSVVDIQTKLRRTFDAVVKNLSRQSEKTVSMYFQRKQRQEEYELRRNEIESARQTMVEHNQHQELIMNAVEDELSEMDEYFIERKEINQYLKDSIGHIRSCLLMLHNHRDEQRALFESLSEHLEELEENQRKKELYHKNIAVVKKRREKDEAKNKILAEDDEKRQKQLAEKQARLEAFFKRVRPKVERSFERAVKGTVSSTAIPEKHMRLFVNDSYEDKQIWADERTKLYYAFREAGLLHSEYAVQAIKNAPVKVNLAHLKPSTDLPY